MAVLAKSTPEARWIRELRAADTLADDLGVIGSWVGPRTGPLKRTKGQKEDYVLRRLLVAWKQTGSLDFPVEVRAETDRKGGPDFLFTGPTGQTLGVEITEAGEENYQRWLTASEFQRQSNLEIIRRPFDVSTDRTVAEIERAIQRKVEKFDQGDYRSSMEWDLVVYENTAWGGFLDKRDLLRRIRRPNYLTSKFRQLHLVSSETVYLDIFGNGPVPVDISGAYEIDYARWIFDQVERLREKKAGELDFAHIAEELEDLGKSERRALSSHLRNLILHLLKWQHQSGRRSKSWLASIELARSEIHELLTESPSLRRNLPEQVLDQYRKARVIASKETGLALVRFPEDSPYTPEQLVDPEYLPGRSK